MLRLSGFSKPFAALAAAAFFIGATAWSGHMLTFLPLLALPILFKHCPNTQTRLTLLFCYYSGSIWQVMPGSAQFFGPAAGLHPLSILTLWLVSSAVLTAPWLWLIFAKDKPAAWVFPIGLCMTAMLPTGVTNPLTVAGVLFPGLAWAGLAITIVSFGTIANYPRRTLGAIAILAAICYVSHPHPATTRGIWEGHQTQLGGAVITRETPQQIYRAVSYVQASAIESRASFQVYPEAIISHWTPIADEFWSDTFQSLRDNHQTILFGVEQSTGRHGQYLNELLVRGAYTATYQQRVPIPYAMWRPWDHRGVPLNYLGASTITLGPWRAAPVICYEQLLMAPVLISMAHDPNVIVSVANDYWTNGTSIAAIQESAITSWSRLFRVPIITATNR